MELNIKTVSLSPTNMLDELLNIWNGVMCIVVGNLDYTIKRAGERQERMSRTCGGGTKT